MPPTSSASPFLLTSEANEGSPSKPAHEKIRFLTDSYGGPGERLKDPSPIPKYNFFIFEVVKAQMVVSPRRSRTLRYRGDEVFVASGRKISRRQHFNPKML
jgi:hypothetical protein